MSPPPPKSKTQRVFRLSALSVTLVYVFFVMLWIYIPDYLLGITIDNMAIHEHIEQVIALAFVIVTGLLLFLLLKGWRESTPESITAESVGAVHRNNISRQVLLFISLVMIVPLIGLAIVKLYVPQVERNAYRTLQSITKLKTDQIQAWLEERDGDARVLSRDDGFSELVEKYLQHPNSNSRALKLIKKDLNLLHKIHEFDTVLLLTPKGKLITGAGSGHNALPPHLPMMKIALKNRKVIRTDLLRDESGRIVIDWLVPIIDDKKSSSKKLAIVVLRVTADHFLYPLIKSWPIESATAESMLVRSRGGSLVYLNKLKHHGNNGLEFSLADHGLPSSIAISANKFGTYHGKDYRGIDVLAAFRPVKGTDWYIISKMDHDEILQPVWRMLQWVTIISLTAIFIIMALLMILWSQQRRTHLLLMDAQSIKAIEESERRFRSLATSANEAIISADINSKIIFWNPAAERMFGYSEAEAIGQSLSILMPEHNREEHLALVANAAKTVRSDIVGTTRELIALRKNGDEFPVNLSLGKWETDSGIFFTAIIRDISKRKENEARIQRLTQLYAAINQSNKAIVNCDNEDELFQQICNIAVTYGGMQLAWIGMVDDDGTRVNVVAKCGDHTEYLDHIDIVMYQNSKQGHGPTATAIRDDKPYWCNDFMHDPGTVPWRERAMESGWKASAVIPLHKGGKAVGALTVYRTDINAFDNDVRDLLLEMTSNINYAIDNLAVESRRQESEKENYVLGLRYQALMQTSFDGVHVMDDEGNIIEANDAFCNMLGYTREETSKLNVSDWDVKWTTDELKKAFKEFVGKSALIETTHRRKDGTLINVEISASGVELDGKNYFFGASRDVTERKNIERELRISATAFETQEGILVADENHHILRVNEAFTNLFGYSAEEAIGKSTSLLNSQKHDVEFFKEMWVTIERDRYWQGEIWNKRKNGEVSPYWMTITAVLNDDDVITNYIASYSDLSQHKKDEAEIYSLAFYDQLTNLPNRRHLINRLKRSLNASKRHKNYGAIMFIDLDNFKALNDTRGHVIGDMLLVEVAQRLQQTIRSDDMAGRLGGDEFVIVLDSLSPDPVEAAARANIVSNKLLESIRQPYLLVEEKFHVTTSIGISLFHGKDDSIDELLKHADIAMYHAKSDGRDTSRFYDPSMQAQLELRIELEKDLRVAIDENQFKLYYQMQVDHHRHAVGAEALIRWHHPERGLIPPMQFIPLAEDTGQIITIGQWALNVACEQLKAWESDPVKSGLNLAVNVSAQQFHQKDFVERVVETINKYKIKPYHLKLELTETLVLDNIEDTIFKMKELKKSGVLFSMDDFGTGYSSLSYLSQLPLDQLKIDQSFVRNISKKHNDAIIVQTIIGMADSLVIEVIAEGVETESQREFLEGQGCYLYQGYLFSKPVPIDEFEEILKNFS